LKERGAHRREIIAGICDCLDIAAKAFGVRVADIRSQRRSRDVHTARVWAVYLAAMTTAASFEDIGKAFGNRDETIVRMYARACGRQVEADEGAMLQFRQLRASRKAGRSCAWPHP
jgi:chromosomal replication initiator protein